MKSFEEIRIAAAALMEAGRGQSNGTGLCHRVDALVDSARANADDTIYVEKARPVEDYDAIGLASLQDLLSCSDDAEAAAWFVAQGVVW